MAGRARTTYVVILLLTVGQLVVATFVDGLPQFEGKAFGSRLVAYPAAMLLPPFVWWLVARRRHDDRPLPWAGFAFIAAPFLVDVTGNTLDLYDTLGWWDDANHYVNWLLLCVGIGLLLERQVVRPVWVLVLLVTGIGAALAIGWEVAEWYTFIRHGTELDTAYTDTLGDEVLGTLGAFTAALLLARRAGHGRGRAPLTR
jgi:uncharacterized membrane protein YjdF